MYLSKGNFKITLSRKYAWIINMQVTITMAKHRLNIAGAAQKLVEPITCDFTLPNTVTEIKLHKDIYGFLRRVFIGCLCIKCVTKLTVILSSCCHSVEFLTMLWRIVWVSNYNKGKYYHLCTGKYLFENAVAFPSSLHFRGKKKIYTNLHAVSHRAKTFHSDSTLLPLWDLAEIKTQGLIDLKRQKTCLFALSFIPSRKHFSSAGTCWNIYKEALQRYHLSPATAILMNRTFFHSISNSPSLALSHHLREAPPPPPLL